MIALYANDTGRLTFARKLARELGIATLAAGNNINRPALGEIALLNWGSSTPILTPDDGRWWVNWLGNTPTAVKRMSNKLHMFRAFRDAQVPCLEWTDNIATAREWKDAGHAVYERHVLTGHSGAGIRVVTGDMELQPCRLYTKDLGGKFREYRVHMVDGHVVCAQIKRKMSAEKIAERGFRVPEGEERRVVRTYRNGWAFCVNGFELPESGRAVAVAAMGATWALTGAVDIAVRSNGTAVVIETNSAPALRSPTVLEGYVDALADMIGYGEG